ncbi:YhcN/YlaJ family sporulation lipoprotein [Sutcliffiella deserti]|uniref:YhcN/YlaJ family sporulation lipoprotein n=1 Tax=Sutcliffiella deserti TaxID=2875501 RepID=UPI001CBC312E|nr:YhcN/YlaJ family sporulation lipoprotein [Sutcliffiella deserti]
MKNLSFMLLIVILAISGCNNGPRNISRENENSQVIHVKDSADVQVDRKTGQEISAHLVEIASRTPNVNDATAVVLGHYAVVGIDVNSDLDRSKVSTIKYSVAESLKSDPYGATAVVVADADSFVRLQEMGRDIQRGRPLTGVMEELAEIVGRVMPEVPMDLREPTAPNPTEQNNSQLSDDSERELEEEQQKQSNGHKNEKSN